jgi:hypothetical protein
MAGVNYVDLAKSVAGGIRLDDAIDTVAELKSSSLVKAGLQRQIVSEQAARSPKSAFFDPLSLQYAMGYKDRRYSLTYETLRRISNQLAILNAIINTRVAQVASFSQPYRHTKSLGFVVKHKDPEHMTTDAERAFIKQLEGFVSSCGEPGRYNPYSRFKRDDFEGLIRKIVRDSLVYDQVAMEIVPRSNGIPFEFVAVDASTIRIASSDKDVGSAWSYHQRNTIAPLHAHRFQGMYQGKQYGQGYEQPTNPAEPRNASENSIQYVQVVNGQIENVYTGDELIFGIRNPRTDIYIQGYGYSELEQMITIVTSMLFSEEHNKRYFTNGAHPKGILNFKGDNWTPETLENFKRQWVSSIQGTENAWRTPITQSDGLEWVNLQMSNRDMEFGQWLEYLIKILCGVFLIDPAEINFDLHGGVQQTPLFESSQEWKLKASRDRGLRPLLRFIAKLINRNIIDRIDDHFVFEFAGLDELTEQEKHELMKEQIGSYLTLNEGRRTLDLPDLPDGDIPMNPTYLQAVQMRQKAEQEAKAQEQEQQQQAQQQQMQAQQQQAQGQPQQGQGQPQGGPPQQAQGGQEAPPEGGPQEQAPPPAEPPQYAANFGKALKWRFKPNRIS